MIANMSQCKLDIPAPLIAPNGTHALHGAKLDNPGFFNKVVLDFLGQHWLLQRCWRGVNR